MSDTPYRVHVVVDSYYAKRIRNLPVGKPDGAGALKGLRR